MSREHHLTAIALALAELPTVCPYHGANLVRGAGHVWSGAGVPCCDSGRAPLRARRAHEALSALRQEQAS